MGLFGGLLAFLWLVGLTNAYNFMDGIDGIAASQAVVAGLTWAVAGYLAGAAWVAAVGLVIAAASLGFMRHNWAPARIFMGDVGSAFLGLSLATLAVGAAEIEPQAGVRSESWPCGRLLSTRPSRLCAAHYTGRLCWRRTVPICTSVS